MGVGMGVVRVGKGKVRVGKAGSGKVEGSRSVEGSSGGIGGRRWGRGVEDQRRENNPLGGGGEKQRRGNNGNRPFGGG